MGPLSFERCLFAETLADLFNDILRVHLTRPRSLIAADWHRHRQALRQPDFFFPSTDLNMDTLNSSRVGGSMLNINALLTWSLAFALKSVHHSERRPTVW
jgi:hypothetical protein